MVDSLQDISGGSSVPKTPNFCKKPRNNTVGRLGLKPLKRTQNEGKK